MSLFQFFKEAEAAPLAPVMVLAGAEAWIRDKLRASWAARALEGAPAEMNFARFDAEAQSAAEAMQACTQFPCFAARRVVVLSHAEALKKADAVALVGYLEDPAPTTVLLVEADQFDGRFDWVKRLQKKAAWFAIPELKTEEAVAWLKKSFKQRGKSWEEGAVERLVDWTGFSLHALENAFEQCCLYLGENTKLTLADLEDLSTKSAPENLFEVMEELFSGKAAEAYQKLNRLLEAGEAPLKILNLLYRHLAILLTVKDAAHASEVLKLFRMPPRALARYEAQARRFSRQLSYDLLKPLAEVDAKIKSSGWPGETLLFQGVTALVGKLN